MPADTTLVRPALEAESVSCRALLPEAFLPSGYAPELFVAPAPESGILGAAALAWVPDGFPLLIRVAEGWRRQGIGGALLRAVMDTAAGETPALRAWGPLAEASPGALFLQAAGFRPIRRLLVFETDAVRFATAMTALLGRFRAAGRVPADVRLASLDEAPPSEVVRLVTQHMATQPHDVAWRIAPGAPNGYNRALSLVLMRDVRVVAAMLCRRHAEAIEVDVNVVAPDVRRGWANLLLLEGMARLCRAAGIRRFRFSCEEHVRDTLNLARRSGAVQLPAQLVLALPLDPATMRMRPPRPA